MDLSAWKQAQESVIGTLLLWPDQAAGEVFQVAKPAFFADPALRHVFEAAQELWSAGKPLDPVTILSAAGNEYHDLLRTCMEQTPTVVNLGEWLKLCRSAARLTAMQTEAMTIIGANRETDAAAAWERMGTMLQDSDEGEDLTLGELIGDYLDRMQDKRPVKYLNFGIEQLDKELYVGPGQFGVIAADSSVGKTALALQFAYHMAEQGHNVGFFSLETPKENLEDRLMAGYQVAGIPLPVSKRKQLEEDDYRKAAEAGMKSDRIRLRLLRNYETLERIRAKTIQRRFDVIFIDYVQLIDAPGQERWNIVTNISMGLHRMAQQLGITVIGLSQITPAVKGQKAPTKDDLRESRQLKQDADFILLLYPYTEDDAKPNERVLEIAKNKDGRCARLRMDFIPEHMSFQYHTPGSVSEFWTDGQVAKQQAALKRAKPGQMVEIPMGEQEEMPF
jgi:replicative DNA helicase